MKSMLRTFGVLMLALGAFGPTVVWAQAPAEVAALQAQVKARHEKLQTLHHEMKAKHEEIKALREALNAKQQEAQMLRDELKADRAKLKTLRDQKRAKAKDQAQKIQAQDAGAATD